MDVISNNPFWRVKIGLLDTYPTLDENLKCDVVIVGSGISGALIAHSLTKENLSVVLIDKYDIGSGSTSGSTALIQYETDLTLTDLSKKIGPENAERAYRTCFNAVNKLEKICREVSHSSFKRRSSIYLAGKKSDVKKLRDEFRARKKLGLDCKFIERKEIRKMLPFSRPAAITNNHAAVLDPYTLTHQLLQSSLKRNLKIFDRTEMKRFKTTRNKVTVDLVNGKKIIAKKLVMATGYEIAKYLPKKLVDLNSTFAIISKPIENLKVWKKETLIWEMARPYHYLRLTEDKRAIIGGLDEEFYNPTKRDQLIPTKRRKLQKSFQKFFPKLKFEVAYSWAGTFAETKDGLPYIGSIEKYPNCYFACGYGGNGIIFSVIAADLIRDQIINRSNLNAEIFGFERNQLRNS